jgi:ubiquinone/menaquinone biosynthesis C-methylase UbiE
MKSTSLIAWLVPWRRSCPIPTSRTTRVEHPLCARLYVRQSERADRLGLAHRRADLLADLSGKVLEIGAGNGRNFAHYPSSVTEVIAVEPEPHLREHAERAARVAPVPVTVLDAVAEELPFSSSAFDAAVASLMLCSVTDVPAVLSELHRVLRADGELRFFEHVASQRLALRALQRTADATVWPRLSGGCHLGRETDRMIEDAGFAIERCERFAFRIPPLDPPKSHVLGRARRQEAS